MSKKKNLELWGLVLWNIPAFMLSSLYGENYLITAVFFFVIPALYLSFRKPEMIRKILITSLVIVIPSVAILNYFAHTDGSWYNFSVVGIRLLGAYPIDDFLWGILYFYYIIAVYEYFFERERILKTPKKFLSFEIAGLLASVLFSLFVIFSERHFVIEFFYIKMVVVVFLLIPGLIFLFHRQVFLKAVYAGLFFLPLSFLYEYIANIKGNWIFPGSNFIGHVQFLSISFPLEEFLWLLFAAPAVIALYEFIADDDR